MIRGPWLHTILFEIPVLAIVNEVYFRALQTADDFDEGRRRLRDKIALLNADPALDGVRIADYGTRRRFSRHWHEEVLLQLKAKLGEKLAGTSNVMYAAMHGMTPLGTMAHEYLQACQALGPRLRDSQTFGFEMWAREYRGDLGIALSDVYGMDAFLRDFDMYFCKLFDGARHDSGDPLAWGERLIAHYQRNRVDPRTKTLVFSDSLTIPKVIELYLRFRDRARTAFGVGTNLTNDVGHTPLQIVIKMVRCNGQPVAKLSDSPDKNLCDDPAYLAYLRQVFSISLHPLPISFDAALVPPRRLTRHRECFRRTGRGQSADARGTRHRFVLHRAARLSDACAHSGRRDRRRAWRQTRIHAVGRNRRAARGCGEVDGRVARARHRGG